MILPLAAALGGILVGLVGRQLLLPAGYRLPEERTRQPRRHWFMPVVLGPAWYLLAATHGDTPATLALLLAWSAALLVLAAIDLDVHRLPDRIQLPAILVTALGVLVVALLEHALTDAGRALAGGMVLGATYFLLFALARGALGYGDVKLAVLLGLVLGLFGWGFVIAGALLGPLVGGLYAIPALVLRRRGRHDFMPLGPSLMIGAFLAVIAAGPA